MSEPESCLQEKVRGGSKMNPGDLFGHIGSIVGSLIFVWAMFKQFFPYQVVNQIEKHSQRLVTYVYPYIQITFNEFTGERLMRSEAYSAIENYLSSKASTQAKKLKGDIGKNNQSLVLSMDDHEEVGDEFSGVKLWWASGKHISKAQSTISFHHPMSDERRYYKLTFHKRNRDVILGTYLNYVMKEGKAIKVKNRQRKLYTNSGSYWSHVMFEHPATFQTLAMDPEEKEMIIDDLITFSKSGGFYARIGRAWKRGYLLYGPPGTGKSTMIAAMANLLGYDLYDLELTAVKDNTELRKLLIETSSKSIIVIEDIDCSLDLTGQRRKKKEKEEEEQEQEKNHPGQKQQGMQEKDVKSSQVTLSGLLNFIDGLWSASAGERLIVFTTNYVEKLDPALVRKGRMDLHIELSYCGFEAFKLLAKNYLNIDAHHLFGTISELLKEIKITPAEVAEHLMPKNASGDAEIYLKSLIQALESTKMQEKVVHGPHWTEK
ncbi:AAA-ATPase ASD, mitochondrial-like isoform X1 [Vigna umbellata]|uniref:AAA-ATPase ASD, mitochondrial-like isoform X1 n=1 Tax=Vigna umbellata TaxID=87088 RepID=UPI001F5FCB83|nr:AAA-ATPase ASD, mitochondrial-like isoform X1 [Vigna umbellata]